MLIHKSDSVSSTKSPSFQTEEKRVWCSPSAQLHALPAGGEESADEIAPRCSSPYKVSEYFSFTCAMDNAAALTRFFRKAPKDHLLRLISQIQEIILAREDDPNSESTPNPRKSSEPMEVIDGTASEAVAEALDSEPASDSSSSSGDTAEDGFQTVKKRRHRKSPRRVIKRTSKGSSPQNAPSSSAALPTPVSEGPPTPHEPAPTQIRHSANYSASFPALPTSVAPAAQAIMPPAPQIAPQVPAASTPKIPPIIIRDPSKWSMVSSQMGAQKINFSSAKAFKDGIRVLTPTSDTFRALTRLLENLKVQYHTYTLPEDRTLRAVLRTIPVEVTTERILADLTRQGFHPIKVTRMVNQRTKKAFPLVMVEVPQGEKIYALKAVENLIVSVERPKPSFHTSQCHRCQGYHHSQRNCHANVRCVKCGQAHDSRDCSKSRDLPALCANCGGEHTANYRGCPSYPKPRRTPRRTPTVLQATPPAANFTAAPPQQNASPVGSFANVAASQPRVTQMAHQAAPQTAPRAAPPTAPRAAPSAAPRASLSAPLRASPPRSAPHAQPNPGSRYDPEFTKTIDQALKMAMENFHSPAGQQLLSIVANLCK